MTALHPLVQAHYDGINAHDLDAMAANYADDVRVETPSGPLEGIAAYRQLGQVFLTAAPDQRIEALRSYECGDTVVTEGVYSGTHTGPLATPNGEVPATGRAFSFPFCEFIQVRDGMVVWHRVYWDNASFMAQLGLLPEPASA